MMARGINVAIGTDSCASSADLNLVDDLRRMHEIAPDAACETLWQMATIRAARALQLDAGIGSITPGKRADFTAFAAVGNDPLRAILESDAFPSNAWIDGVSVRPSRPASPG
jgi:cytosine/adenosine deaminase-related metal-dependent hydrolase